MRHSSSSSSGASGSAFVPTVSTDNGTYRRAKRFLPLLPSSLEWLIKAPGGLLVRGVCNQTMVRVASMYLQYGDLLLLNLLNRAHRNSGMRGRLDKGGSELATKMCRGPARLA